MNSEGADQMRRLICAFVVCIWQKTGFLMTWLVSIPVCLLSSGAEDSLLCNMEAFPVHLC